MEIIIASKNVNKVRELRTALKDKVDCDILSLHPFPDYKAPEETGKTFAENAKIKALHATKTLGKTVVADDSGLIVPILEGKPGVFSKRYAGENGSDLENRKKLLREMETYSGIDRFAYFTCCLTLAKPDGTYHTFEGTCEGYITKEERGSQGFGYDAIFAKHDYDKTFGEIPEHVKLQISHRGKALEKLIAFFLSEPKTCHA